MPELPEVETIRRGLEPWVLNQTIAAVQILDQRSLKRHETPDFSHFLKGKTIEGAHRRGKYLWLTFKQQSIALVIHLGMSGQLLIQAPDKAISKHTKIILSLSNKKQLRFVDQRIFGGMFLDQLQQGIPCKILHIAADPLAKGFTPPQAKNRAIKRLLLDQSWVSGIGNIYADESLWRAGINYNTPATMIPEDSYKKLWEAIKEVLQEAISAGGTSFDELYVKVNGNSGYFDRKLNVYGREDSACAHCGTAIVREKFMNRSSFFCPQCQK
ncbi:MAG: bifunctional DNA-formamidopyrimidine glycosylase/DNA-(apurinic or apyrimidinic site) lyase [Micrococcaceae bacterium]